MKRICLDARMIFHSGIGTYLRNLIQGLNQEKFFVILIVHPDHVKKLTWLNQFSLVFAKAKIYSFREQVVLPRIVPKCDVFISPHFNVPVLPIEARRRIVVIHDVYHLRHLSEFGLLQRLYAQIMYRFAVRKSDQVITVSNFSKLEIQKLLRVKSSKIQVISLAVNHSYFQKRANLCLIESIRKKYQLPEAYFLFVGSKKAHKNLKGTMKAFNEFSQEHKSGLVVVGVSSKDAITEAFSEKACFLNFVENVELKVLYQQSCGLIFPSFYEGFGFPPLEAMSSGCPVITSKLASIPEVCGDAAIYVDPNNSKEICQAMRRLMEDEKQRKRWIQDGRQHVQKYSWSTTVDQHERLIKEVL